MNQAGSDERCETSIQSITLSILSPDASLPNPSALIEENEDLASRSEEQKESRSELVEWRPLDEEFLKHVIHEVGTALMVILWQAELVKRDVSRKATALTPEMVRALSLEHEQDQMSGIISQVYRIEQLMTMLTDAAWQSRDAPP